MVTRDALKKTDPVNPHYGFILRSRTIKISAAGFLLSVAAQFVHGAQNCIDNGDFESPGAGYNYNTRYSYHNQSGGKPTGWVLSPNNRTGLVDEGNGRFEVFDLMGGHSLFLERRKGDTSSSCVEARKDFIIPAPGIYRLTLNYSNWGYSNIDYPHVQASAQLILPDGSSTCSLKDFKPKTYENGCEGIGTFAADTPSALTAYGEGNTYTLRFYSTQDISARYGYVVIDNVNVSLHTLKLGENETFSSPFGLEPCEIDLADGSSLIYAPTTETSEIISGKVTVAGNAKIKFDMANATASAYIFRTGGFVLPAGESDPFAVIQLANEGDYAVSLIDEGKSIVISKPSAPLSVIWTGGGNAADPLDAANWSSVPDSSTLSVRLNADADWRTIGSFPLSRAATVDLNGHGLKLPGLSGREFSGAAITNSSEDAVAVLTVDIAAGVTNENTSVALQGNIRLLKDGAGSFKATRKDQTYWGGTVANDGTLISGTHGRFHPFGRVKKNLIANGDFEANGLSKTRSYYYTKDIPAPHSKTIVGWETSFTSGTGLFNAYHYWGKNNSNPKSNDPQYEWYGYALFFGAMRLVQQPFHVDEPGVYRLYFEYGPWIDDKVWKSCETAVRVSRGDETVFLTKVKPSADIGYRQFFADVEIASAGDYVLAFDSSEEQTSNSYCIIDNVSFARASGISIMQNATLDMNGREGCGLYSISVAGGTLKNEASAMSANKTGFADVALSADSTMSIVKDYAISGYGNGCSTLDLGGKELSVEIEAEKTLSLRDVKIENGTVNVMCGGWLQSAGDGVDARTADFIINSAMRIDAPVAVRDYTALYEANYNGGEASLNVYGVFTPATRFFYGCTMQDGSVIDLSAKNDVWSMTSSFTSGKRDVDFAANAVVNIEVGERVLAIGDRVASWSSIPPVENNVIFSLVRKGVVSETLALAVRDDGLYVKRAAEPAYAVYDVADRAWRFYAEGEVEITDWNECVTPNMRVRFSSYDEYAECIAAEISPAAYVLTGDLTLPAGEGVLDMTTVPFEFAAGVTIDLNGRTLKLPEAMMGGDKPFTVTSSQPGGVLIADVAGALDNTAMTLSGHLKLIKTGAGTFTAAKKEQTYTGGTEVTDGVLRCAIDGNQTPFGMQGEELISNGNFDADERSSWYGAKDWSASPGNWCGRQPAGSYMSEKLPVGNFAMIGGSQVKAGPAAQFWQDVEITVPGCYRYSFDHARRKEGYSLDVDVLLVHNGVERLLTVVTPMTVDTFTRTTGCVEISEAGTYTLKFRYHKTPADSTESYYFMIFDNVSLKQICEIRATGENATIDMNGKVYYYDYGFVLDRGVLSNAGADPDSNRSKIEYLNLEDDSTMNLAGSYGFFGDGYNRGSINLDTHKLTVNIANGKSLSLFNMTFDEGCVVLSRSEGKLITGMSGKEEASGVIAATNVDFSVGCALNLFAQMDVGGYEAVYAGNSNSGTAPLNVFGIFRPVTPNYYGCTMKDGATLDLSQWQGTWPWSVTSAFTTGANTVVFEDNATIAVKVGETFGKVISWTDETKPPQNVRFIREPSDTRFYSLFRTEDGVYARTGFMITVR